MRAGRCRRPSENLGLPEVHTPKEESTTRPRYGKQHAISQLHRTRAAASLQQSPRQDGRNCGSFSCIISGTGAPSWPAVAAPTAAPRGEPTTGAPPEPPVAAAAPPVLAAMLRAGSELTSGWKAASALAVDAIANACGLVLPTRLSPTRPRLRSPCFRTASRTVRHVEHVGPIHGGRVPIGQISKSAFGAQTRQCASL